MRGVRHVVTIGLVVRAGVRAGGAVIIVDCIGVFVADGFGLDDDGCNTPRVFDVVTPRSFVVFGVGGEGGEAVCCGREGGGDGCCVLLLCWGR